MSVEPPPGPVPARRPESAPRPAGLGWGRRETATERARRMIVQIAVGPSRVTVLTVIGSVVMVLAVLLIGYLTRP